MVNVVAISTVSVAQSVLEVALAAKDRECQLLECVALHTGVLWIEIPSRSHVLCSLQW
jgi:hypothetical protein